MKGRIGLSLTLALALAVIVGSTITIAALDSDDAKPPPLLAILDQCEQIDITSYNSIMAEDFVYRPFVDFKLADLGVANEDFSTCGTEPDLDDLCVEESEECSALLAVVIEHSLWISIDFDCVGFCFLTEEELAEVPEKTQLEGWDWAILNYTTKTVEGEDRMQGGTYRGKMISIFQYENLQITIDLRIGFGMEDSTTDEEWNRFSTAFEQFEAVNLEVAEDIRDSAIARRNG
ncbi:hypothetical protein [Glycomyces paridis]|uniref:DUF3558 domain-containing protein n=1 Tax=Glycomyces paridis TaxID=2126555 RepID=A0A4S8P0C6_9ACTN|nr:hypothetical protein [Glycomyces paridis]THV22042.1 hypothetical protein E9998_23770 [Glycomyces paridis]